MVGVGNIYACEALFAAGIHPRPTRRDVSAASATTNSPRPLSASCSGRSRWEGPRLRDFTVGDGTPGYFGQSLTVYGREGKPCLQCQTPLRREVIGQRSTFFCPSCQR